MTRVPVVQGHQPDRLYRLLRLWRVSDGPAPAWRALLQGSRTGQEVGLVSLDALSDHLRRQTGLLPAEPEEATTDGPPPT